MSCATLFSVKRVLTAGFPMLAAKSDSLKSPFTAISTKRKYFTGIRLSVPFNKCWKPCL